MSKVDSDLGMIRSNIVDKYIVTYLRRHAAGVENLPAHLGQGNGGHQRHENL